MDVFLQAVVVIGAVVIGVRFGSIGLGICGGGGLMILNQVFGLRPTGAPVDVILIILAVVTAASTMQGECLKFCVCPKFITYVALRRGGSLVERSGTSEPPLRRFRSSHHSILA